MKMKTVALLGAAYMLSAAPFIYADAANVKEYKQLSQQAKINIKQAMDAAVKRVEGTVIKAELDKKDGAPIYEVEVLSGDSVFEVKVNASTSEIIEVNQDKG